MGNVVEPTEALTIYAVRNADGEWFRSLGYGGYGSSWVPELGKAKLYTKLSQARGRVTFWANHCPDREPPVIVQFTMSLSDAVVLQESERVAKAKLKKSTEEAEHARREAKRKLRDAEETIRKAEEEIRRLRKDVKG